MEYGQWLNLTFVVTPCNITDVHWYTTGDRRSLDNSDLLGNAQYQFMSGSCKDNVTEFQFNIRITEVTHGILNGAVFAFGDQRCFSLPSARYYIDSSPGKIKLSSVIFTPSPFFFSFAFPVLISGHEVVYCANQPMKAELCNEYIQRYRIFDMQLFGKIR